MKKDIIIFGKGDYYATKKKQIEELYNVKFFLDNSLKYDEVIFDSKEKVNVYNPQKIKELSGGNMPILLMSVRWLEMWKQLMELGVEDERIIFGISIPPYLDVVEEMFFSLGASLCSRNGKIVVQYETTEKSFASEEEYKEAVRKMFYDRNPYIKLISDMPLVPTSKRFGQERGKAIDRFYIEKFLGENEKYICGTVMEIAERRYTKMFGKNAEQSLMLHINGWGEGVIKGNLATGEGIVENSVDCMICTQTIQFIYDIHSCVKNIYKLLKPGGTALITCGCIAQLSLYDYRNWGEYWRFTEQSLRKLLQESFKEENINIYSYGNMKAAIAFLYGLCVEELSEEDLDYKDIQYPLIIAAVVRKE